MAVGRALGWRPACKRLGHANAADFYCCYFLKKRVTREHPNDSWRGSCILQNIRRKQHVEDSVHGICPAHLPYWPSRSSFWHDYPFVFDGDGKKRSVPEVGYLLLSSYGDAGHGYAAAPVPDRHGGREDRKS